MKLGTERRLGASDAGALLGVGKWANRCDLFGRIVLGVERPSTPQLERGTQWEPEVRRRYIAKTGARMREWVARPVIAEHPNHSWATCSPDDVTTDGVLVEYKTASKWASGWVDKATGNEAIPSDYVLQVAWGLWVTQLEVAHLFVLFGDDLPGGFEPAYERGPYEFTRDHELERLFYFAGERFWKQHIEAMVPPEGKPMNAIRKYNAALKQLTKGVSP